MKTIWSSLLREHKGAGSAGDGNRCKRAELKNLLDQRMGAAHNKAAVRVHRTAAQPGLQNSCQSSMCGKRRAHAEGAEIAATCIIPRLQHQHHVFSWLKKPSWDRAVILADSSGHKHSLFPCAASQGMAFISPLSLKLSNLSCISHTHRHTQMGEVEGNGVNILEFPCTVSFSLVVTLQGQLSAHDFNQVLREQTWKPNSREESSLRRKEPPQAKLSRAEEQHAIQTTLSWRVPEAPESQSLFPTRYRFCW